MDGSRESLIVVTYSGKTYLFPTDAAASGVSVYALPLISNTIVATGISDGAGDYSLQHSSSGNILYVPYASGYTGYARVLSSEVLSIPLWVASGSSIPDATSNFIINTFGATLVTSPNVVDLITTPCQIFALTDGGLDVVDVNGFCHKAHLFSDALTAIWLPRETCSNFTVVLGTVSNGLYHLDWTDTIQGDLSTVAVKRPGYSLNSSGVTGIAGNTLGDLLVATTSGLTFIDRSEQSYFCNFSGGVSAVLVTPSGDLYYSPVGSGLYGKRGPVTANWEDPDFILSTSGDLLRNNIINDIVVTNQSGVNEVFLASPSGVSYFSEHYADPSQSQFYHLDFGLPISGTVASVVSIDCSTNSCPGSGIISLATYDSSTNSGTLQEIDLTSTGVIAIYNVGLIESNFKRAGIPISGVRLVQRLLG